MKKTPNKEILRKGKGCNKRINHIEKEGKMKKYYIVLLTVLFAVGLVFASNTAAVAAPDKPVRGGTLRCVARNLSRVLGYPAQFDTVDMIFSLPVLEKLVDWEKNAVFTPVLAESWEGDPEALTITWHLRKGVKFHDGTDWNAEALKWNFERIIEGRGRPSTDKVKSLEVVDEYTLVMHLSEFNWMMFEDFGFAQMISPTAFEKAGGGDMEKGKQWARMNPVGTGPFKVAEYKRDAYIKYIKNDNYWRQGMPYLDGIEIHALPDPMVAAAKLEAGEADMWLGVTDVPNILDLKEKGYKINWELGMSTCIIFDSNNPKSIFANKKVRDAIEYAIDRPAIAKMLGQGLYEPLFQLARAKSPTYIEGYNPRPYNPEKAKQLLAEAGYHNGFKTTMLALPPSRDAVSALKSYLGNIGIDVSADVADFGRYFGSVFGTGFKDMALSVYGNHPDGKEIFVHFGPNPATFRTGDIYKSPKFLSLCNEALSHKYMNAAEAKDKIKEAIKQAGEDAIAVPLWKTVNVAIMYPYVQSDYYTIHTIIWTPYDDFMEKH